jgi:hypothetical protein
MKNQMGGILLLSNGDKVPISGRRKEKVQQALSYEVNGA